MREYFAAQPSNRTSIVTMMIWSYGLVVQVLQTSTYCSPPKLSTRRTKELHSNLYNSWLWKLPLQQLSIYTTLLPLQQLSIDTTLFSINHDIPNIAHTYNQISLATIQWSRRCSKDCPLVLHIQHQSMIIIIRFHKLSTVKSLSSATVQTKKVNILGTLTCHIHSTVRMQL